MTSAWFGFVIIIFLTAWMLALITFTILSLFIRCVDCVDGSIIIRRRGSRWRTKAMKESLVTTKVMDHAFMNDKCQNFLKNRMSYSIPYNDNDENNKSNDDDDDDDKSNNDENEKNIHNDEADNDVIEIGPLLCQNSARDENMNLSECDSNNENESESDNELMASPPLPLPQQQEQCQEINTNTNFNLNSSPPQCRTSHELESSIYHNEEKSDEEKEEKEDHYDDDDDEGEKHCSICLEAFKVGDSVSWSKHLTHCNHVFHTECITTWLERKTDCPCCRAPFFTKDDLDLHIQGCRGFIAACFGCGNGSATRSGNSCGNKYCPNLCFNRSQNKDERNKKNGFISTGSGAGTLIEIGLDTDDKILHKYRKGAEFCVVHGLIFPPGYVILTKSDEEINGIKRARTRRRFWSTSSSADYYDMDMEMDIEAQQELEYILSIERMGMFDNQNGNDTNNDGINNNNNSSNTIINRH